MGTNYFADTTHAAYPHPDTPIHWSRVLLMLVSRTLLFVLFQALIAAVLALLGTPSAWRASAGWWLHVAALANVASILLLAHVFRLEGIRLRDVYAFDRQHMLGDILVTLGLLAISGVLSFFPNQWVGGLLFGDPEAPTRILFPALPLWAALLTLLFPITIAFAELPTYFAYVMPRLKVLTGRWWIAVLLAGFWLSAQHCTLPLVFDWRFIAWRLLMFLLFALFVAAALAWRPRLLPYLMIGHFLIDLPVALLLIQAAV